MPTDRIQTSPADEPGRPTPSPAIASATDWDAPSDAATSGPEGARGRGEAASSAREEALLRELDDRERRAVGWERAFKSTLREKAIAEALAGRPLVPGAASQLVRLWRDEFDVVEEDGSFRVAARDGRDVGRAVGEMLASPEYGHFSRPPSRGGTAVAGANRPLPGGPSGQAPRTLGESALRSWREAAAGRPGDGPGPIGLRPRR